MKSNILIFLSAILCAFSCNSVKMDSAETATKLVEFSKSPCYGTCPSYSLVINTDGSMEYIGKRHVDRMGVYTSKIDADTYKAIYTSLKKENMYQYDDVYNADVADGSKTRIIYYGDQGKKAFGTLYTYPGNTKALAETLESIANSEKGWVAMETEDNQPVVKEDKPTRKILSYSQGACFGTCPVYSIDVFSDRRMMYIGKANSKRKGIFGKTMKEKDFEEILALVKTKEFTTVDTKEDEMIMDAQQFRVLYAEDERTRREVKWKIDDTQVLKDIREFFQNQADSRGWEETTPENSTSTDEMTNTMIISINPEIDAKDWVLTKRHLEAKIVKFLSPNGTYFLLQVNPELNLERVKEELRRDKNVLNVQDSNRPARPRSTGPKASKSGQRGTATIKKDGN